MPTDFTALSLTEIHAEIDAVSRDTESTFGRLTEAQLNWKPGADRWSAGQCFDHLIRINGLMLDGMARAVDGSAPRSLVLRIPGLPTLFGRLMIRSLSPTSTRKLPAPTAARPATSDIPGDIVGRFVAAQATMRERLRSFEHRDLAATIMVSPFASVVVYSVLDAARLIVAHERRHFEQARRVTETPGFPG
jgi:hypothetical protein